MAEVSGFLGDGQEDKRRVEEQLKRSSLSPCSYTMNKSFGSVVLSHGQKHSGLFSLGGSKAGGWGWVWCTLLTCAGQGKSRPSASGSYLRFFCTSSPFFRLLCAEAEDQSTALLQRGKK